MCLWSPRQSWGSEMIQLQFVTWCCKQSSAAGIAYHAQEKPPRVHLIQKGFQDPQRLTDVLLPVLACLLERRFLRCLHIHMAVV